MADMTGNIHFADHLIDYTNSGDGRAISALVAANAFEQRTANLIAVYQEESLTGRLNMAEQYELQNTILERTGLRDA